MNKYQPHLFVLPEDDRDRQIANGFALHGSVDDRRIQVMPPAGGWSRVLDTFRDEYIPHLQNFDRAYVILLIDFDGKHSTRHADFASSIPGDLGERVFVIGPQTTPEDLRQALCLSYEKIGTALADDCDAETTSVWGHEQLQHNERERERLVNIVRPFLFNHP